MTGLSQIVYSSVVNKDLNFAEITTILKTARQKNKERDVTGLLLHDKQNFIQAFEGPTHEVDKLFSTILADPRHHNVNLLSKTDISKRSFPDWRMGFAEINGSELYKLYGCYHLLGGFRFRVIRHFLDGLNESYATRLLKNFVLKAESACDVCPMNQLADGLGCSVGTAAANIETTSKCPAVTKLLQLGPMTKG